MNLDFVSSVCLFVCLLVCVFIYFHRYVTGDPFLLVCACYVLGCYTLMLWSCVTVCTVTAVLLRTLDFTSLCCVTEKDVMDRYQS